MRTLKLISFLIVYIFATFTGDYRTMLTQKPIIAETGQSLAVQFPAIAPAFESGTGATTLPALDTFVQSVINGNANEVVGVYVPGTFALTISQQPGNEPNFVSRKPEIITQFAPATRFNTIGLLAHNYLAGDHFYDLSKSQTIILVYGTGNLSYYKIIDIQRYQALSPNSPQSDFVDLNTGANEKLSAADLFQRIYSKGNQVVFQTCINAHGDPSWGRIFIIATPVESRTDAKESPLRSRILSFF